MKTAFDSSTAGKDEDPESLRWMTIRKASEVTGLSISFLYERTSASHPVSLSPRRRSGFWKWFGGRKLVDLAALYAEIEASPNVRSMRGRQAPQARGDLS